jgi:hypothetical protein
MRKVVLFVLLLAGFSGAMAQEVYNSSGKTNYKNDKKKSGFDPDKLVLGGGATVGIGGGFARLGASPIVGYRLADHFYAGVGCGYLYTKAPYDDIHYVYQNIIYPNVWARYFVYRNFFINATYEYDIITQRFPLDNKGQFNETTFKYNNSALLAGLGIKQPLGGRVCFYGELFYDVLQGKYSPYPKGWPTMRFGIAAGF